MPRSSTLERLLTIEDVAQYLQVPRKTLYGWRHRREALGPLAIKVGGQLRWRPADVEAWLVEHQGR
jgi:excisionase family DNA binding protein